MTHIEQRSDYAAIWTIRNPILNRGEVGWEEDTLRSKLGDGFTPWNDLPYANPGPEGPEGPAGPQGAQGPQGVQGPPGALTGVAGGDLTGSYPNPTIKADVALAGNPTAATQATANDSTRLATTAFVKAQGYAPLANPTFTGDPKAPTPATSDNDTSLATTAFVKNQAYAPLDSPALTGNPTAPTATAGDDDTSIATTAFVKSAVDSPLVTSGTFANVSPFTNTVVLRKAGGLVVVSGAFARASGFSATLTAAGTVPPGFRPLSDVAINGVFFNTSVTWTVIIETGGAVTIRMSAANSSAMTIGGLSWIPAS